MFLLFYLIFAVVWVSLVAVIFSITNNYAGRYEIIKVASVALISYSALLTLPSIAVSVRRIRDVGLSGWLILAILVSNIVGIWLRNNMAGSDWTLLVIVLQLAIGVVWLVLMITEGNSEKNKYGENPKTSPSTLNEKIMLQGTSVALIVGAIVSLVTTVYFLRMFSLGVSTIPYVSYIRLASSSIILIAAVLLQNIKSINELFTKGKKVFILMLPAIAMNVVIFIIGFNNAVSRGNALNIFSSATQLFLWLSLAFLLVSILFFGEYKKYIRIAVVTIIVLASSCLLLSIYNSIVVVGFWRLDTLNILHSYANIRYVAYIMLASIFLVQKEIMPDSIKRIFSKCQ